MLKGMRKAASGVFAKILLTVLILSFAVWGIGDIFRGGNPDTLAVAGDDTITISSFEQNLQRLRRNFGENYSEELFAQLNIPGQLLETMINKSLMHQEARTLGLRIDDTAIASTLAQNPEFKGADGTFDPNLLSVYLRNTQFSEAQFMQNAREDLASELLRNSFFATAVVPDALVNLIYAGQYEKRRFDVVVFDTKNTPKPTIDAAALETFYMENEALFIEREKRRIAIMLLAPENLQNQVTVSDEDVESYYAENIDNYALPEQREVKQLLFSSESDAQTAFNAIDSGTPFVEVAASSPIKNKDTIDLGFVGSDAIFDEAADLVFSMNTGDHTVPLQSPFGWHIFKVESIQSPQSQPLDAVKADIALQLQQEAFEERLYTLSGDIDDAIAGGASLEDVSKQFGATITTTDLIEAGETIEDDVLAGIVGESFTQEEGTISPLRVTQDGTYYVTQILEVQEAAAPAFDPNNKEVQAKARETLNREAVRKAANTFYATHSTAALASTAAEASMPVYTSEALGRTDATLSLKGTRNIDTNTALITALFQLDRDNISAPFPLADGRYLVAQVKKVIDAPDATTSIQTREKLEQVQEQMREMLNVELNTQYLMYLRQKYGVSVNQDAINSLFGAPNA